MKLCADCVSGVLLPGKATGSMIKVGAFDCYLAEAPAPAPVADRNAIILFTDIFGLPLENPKILADSFAKETGLNVYVPDMFNGVPPLRNDDLMPYDHNETGKPVPYWKTLGFIYYAAKASPSLIFGSNRPPKVCARMKTFVEVLKQEKKLEKVGAVGYCYGGTVIASLAPHHVLSSAVICHPGELDLAWVKEMDFPVSWVTCEEDFTFPPKKAEQAEEILSSRKGDDRIDFEFKRYMGTRHGFGARPALDVPVVKKAFEDASDQTVAWFKKTLL